ncbi:MAG: cell division protein FtsB [Fluviibacter sp.]|jgi:cell division protein FtsB
MRPSTAILLGLAVVIQYPLWLGKGGWLKVWESDRQLRLQREANRQLELRNAGLEAETRNLKSGLEAVEERARYELGMIKPDEVFYQLPKRSVMPKPEIADSAATPPKETKESQ